MALETLVAALCLALSVAFVWPQVFRVFRLGTVEGLSPRGTLHGMAGNCAWLVYGGLRGNLPLVLSNINIIVALLLIASAQIRHGVLTKRALALTLAGATGLALGLATISTSLTGWMAIVVGATSIIPQTLHVLQNDDLSGVSLTMYGLVIANGFLWSFYGILANDLLLLVPNILFIPCATVVVARTLKSRTQLKADAALAC